MRVMGRRPERRGTEGREERGREKRGREKQDVAGDSAAAAARPRVVRRMLALLRPYTGRMALAALLLIVTNGLGLIFPLVIRSLLNTILVRRDAHLLNLVVEGLIVLFVVQAVIGAVQNYIVTAVGERFSFDLRVRLFQHLQRLPLSFFDARRTGELMSRVTNDVTLLTGSLTGNVLPLASQVVTLVGSIAIAFAIDWRITLVALVVTPIAALSAGVLGRRIRRTTRGVQRGLGEAGIVLEEALSSPRVVKAFAREEYEGERFSVRMRGSLREALRRARAQAVLGPLTGLIGFLSVVVVIWFGGNEVLAGRLTAGDLVAFIFYLFLVIGPLIALSNLYSQLQAALAAAERVFELLDEPVEPALATPPAVALPPIAGAVAFADVTFAYPVVPPSVSSDADAEAGPPSLPAQPRPPVLRGVSFEALPGQIIALVGPSGAGKTTMLSLLLRLYDVDGGAIRIDGHDIREVDVRSLRDQLALVPQEPTLFGDTIEENIRYGRLDATTEQVREAAAAANAKEFIEQLPDSLGTVVGERGVKLSAGQRQRIAIARALLHDPRILLLDEATAALDNESEALVQDALNRLMRGRTTLVVAHRLTTIERADQILVLDGGVIAERGTHDELLARGGLYARLYTRNFEDFDAPVELAVAPDAVS